MDFFIDRGGTFTDLIAYDPSTSKYSSLKLLSVDPDNYPDAPREGIKRILESITQKKIIDKVPTSMIRRIRMATTVATNALLERKGQRVALLITKGFADALEIGNQARPSIFDLDIKAFELLYEKVVQVDERVLLGGADSTVNGITGESVTILKSPSLNELIPKLLELKRMGISSIAICLCHSWTFSRHELEIGKLCADMGFDNVTLSSKIMPMIKLIPRGNSACADAYLTPTLQAYITSFFSGFDNGIDSVKLEFMQV
jgi:5-oxoprolinase (ATP-hydrolysing)